MYQFLNADMTIVPKGNECLHSQRFFIFVDSVDRNFDEVETTTYKGTQKLHCIASVGEEGHLQCRLRSCYCDFCIGTSEDLEECENREIVDDWKVIDICKIRNSEPKSVSQRKPIVISSSSHENTRKTRSSSRNPTKPRSRSVPPTTCKVMKCKKESGDHGKSKRRKTGSTSVPSPPNPYKYMKISKDSGENGKSNARKTRSNSVPSPPTRC